MIVRIARAITVLLLPALCGVFVPPMGPSAPIARWIGDHCVAADGALTVRPGGHRVSGYFGNLTALGLAEAGDTPGALLGWLRWYVAHAQGTRDGVPDDVTLAPNGRVAARQRPDSTDAYGATFLMVAWRVLQGEDSSPRRFILKHRAAVERIALSVLATQQADGLTWARPNHPVAYAIDNAQVYRGLLDGASLVDEAYKDRDLSRLLVRDADRVRRGMLRDEWDIHTQSFRPFVGTGRPDSYPSADLTVAYPDALAQVAAVLYDIIPSKSPLAENLLERARPALDYGTPTSRTFEFRLMYLAAREQIGKRINPMPFSPPNLCSDAGWELFLYR